VLYVIDPYLNLDPRLVEGIDWAFAWDIPKGKVGRFGIRLDAMQLLTFDQERKILEPLLEDPYLASNFTAQQVDRVQINGKPEWQGTAAVTWQLKKWGAGVSYKYIGGFFDTSATNDVTDELWIVTAWDYFNLYADYRFKSLRLRIGVNNVGDEDPPLADEADGYFLSYHSNRGRQFWASLRWTL
jgi:outer membrane receptor protein involved in Fe transport